MSFIMLNVLVFALSIVISVQAISENDVSNFTKLLSLCLSKEEKFSCLANEAAVMIERSMNFSIQIFDGITLFRNNVELEKLSTSREVSDGFSRLNNAVWDFFKTHIFIFGKNHFNEGFPMVNSSPINYSENGMVSGRKLKKKDKYKLVYHIALGLMGAFTFLSPLLLKLLAVISGQALMAAKIALVVASVAYIKKLIDSSNRFKNPIVKVKNGYGLGEFYYYGDDYDRFDKYYDETNQGF